MRANDASQYKEEKANILEIRSLDHFLFSHSYKANASSDRYGSDLMAVESYSENNLTASIATSSVGLDRRSANHYWLGLASLDDLKTNTLESAAGTLVSQYSGKTLTWTNEKRYRSIREKYVTLKQKLWS